MPRPRKTLRSVPPAPAVNEANNPARELTLRESYQKKIAEWTQELERHRTILREAQTNIDRCEGGIFAVDLLLRELDAKEKATT